MCSFHEDILRARKKETQWIVTVLLITILLFILYLLYYYLITIIFKQIVPINYFCSFRLLSILIYLVFDSIFNFPFEY